MLRAKQQQQARMIEVHTVNVTIVCSSREVHSATKGSRPLSNSELVVELVVAHCSGAATATAIHCASQ